MKRCLNDLSVLRESKDINNSRAEEMLCQDIEIPQNFQQIFQLSNLNRKKNKYKKKGKDQENGYQDPQMSAFQIIKNQYRREDKENGILDFKDLHTMKDNDFMHRMLSWDVNVGSPVKAPPQHTRNAPLTCNKQASYDMYQSRQYTSNAPKTPNAKPNSDYYPNTQTPTY